MPVRRPLPPAGSGARDRDGPRPGPEPARSPARGYAGRSGYRGMSWTARPGARAARQGGTGRLPGWPGEPRARLTAVSGSLLGGLRRLPLLAAACLLVVYAVAACAVAGAGGRPVQPSRAGAGHGLGSPSRSRPSAGTAAPVGVGASGRR